MQFIVTLHLYKKGLREEEIDDKRETGREMNKGWWEQTRKKEGGKVNKIKFEKKLHVDLEKMK